MYSYRHLTGKIQVLFKCIAHKLRYTRAFTCMCSIKLLLMTLQWQCSIANFSLT